MFKEYLLPHKYKTIGWILLISGLILGLGTYLFPFDKEPLRIRVLSIFNDFAQGPNEMEYIQIVEHGIAFELILLMIIFGGLIVGFSKEKIEDEFIYKLRNDSLIWATIFNYFVLTVLILFIYSFTFLHVLVFNIFTPLVFFIIRFNFLKFKHESHEE